MSRRKPWEFRTEQEWQDMKNYLYEYLPTIYITAGAVVANLFDISLGRWSATLLILVGVAIFNMRINYRSGK